MHKYRYLSFSDNVYSTYFNLLFHHCVPYLDTQKHKPIYILIAGLPLNSVVFSAVLFLFYMFLFYFYMYTSEIHIILYSVCLLQFFLRYTLSGTKLYWLLAMSYEWYVSVFKLLQYTAKMTKKKLSVVVFLAGFTPASQTAVQIFADEC